MAVHERSAGFVVFLLAAGDAPPADRARYLLLDYGKHWDFAKGHVEANETDLQAAHRELAEETGLTAARVVPGFAREIAYFFRHKSRGLVRKSVVFFLAEVAAGDPVTLSHEHRAFAFEPFDVALKRTTFATAKQVLRAADEHLRAAAKPA